MIMPPTAEFSFRGIVASVSHLFYLPGNSKSFFLDVFTEDLDDDERFKDVDIVTIVARLEGLHESFQMFHTSFSGPPIGKQFEFRSLTHVSLKIPSQEERRRVLLTTPASRLQPIEVTQGRQIQSQNPSKEKFISYEGIVTDDSNSDSAIYILDQRVTLVLTGLASITNLRIFSRGQRVQIINAHFEKIESKPVLFACGRSFAYSRRDDECDKPNSIHSNSSHSVFQKNALIIAALKFNLNVSQILELKSELESFRSKFCDAKLDSVFVEKFNEKSNTFCNFFNLDVVVTNNDVHRSLLGEYLSKPHICSLSNSKKQKNCKKEGGPTSLVTIANLKEILLSYHEIQLQERRERYSNLCSSVQFDFCQKYSDEILGADRILIGKIVLNPKSGHLELQDVTASIPVCLTGNHLRNSEASFLGDVVHISSFISCLEVCKIGAKILRTLYITCRPDDLQFFNFTKILSDEKSANMVETNFLKMWKVLFSSGSVQVGRNESAYFCGVRQLAPVAGTDHVSTPNEIKILQIPVKKSSLILPGAVIKARAHRPIPQRFSSHLQNHLKKFYQNARWGNKVDVLTDNDDVSIDFDDLSLSIEFSLNEFDDIPENEMVTIIATVSERWLERQQFGFSQIPEDAESLDSIFCTHSLQLKLKDPRLTSQTGSTISLYITNWSGHPYPLGLLPDNTIRISNVIKMVSKKGHAYLTANLFTSFQLIDNSMFETKASEAESQLVLSSTEQSLNAQTDFIIDLVKMLDNPKENLKFRTFTFLVTLETLLKVSVSAFCSSCENQLSDGRCTFVGCHVGTQLIPKFSTRCSAMVEDETAAAILHVQDSGMVKDLLQLSDAEWDHIQEVTVASGELLYLSKKVPESDSGFESSSDFDLSKSVFRKYCQILPQSIYSKFLVHCRPFKKSNSDPGGRDESGHPKLFCLDISKM